MLWACCFVLFCFQTVGGEKKNQRVPRSRSRRHECSHPFFHSLPRALYKPKRLFSSRGGSTEGGKESPLPSLHVSHCSSLVSVFPTHHLQPLWPLILTAGSMTSMTLSSLPPFPTSTVLFCFLIFPRL